MCSKDAKYYVCLLITAGLIFGSRFLLGAGALTAYGTTLVGIFAGVIFGYCTIGMIIPSFMAFIALGFSGAATVPQILQMSLGNQTVLYIISILLLSAMFDQSGLANKLVNWCVTRKFTMGKPWAILLMFMMAAYWASWFISSIPPTIICWALLIDLFKSVGYKSGDHMPAVMMFGVLFAACLGGVVPSFQIGIAANYGMLNAVSGGTLVYNPLSYMAWAFVLTALLFVLFFLFAKYILRPDVSLLEREGLIKEVKEPLSGSQKITAAIFTLFVVGLLLPAVLPQGNCLKAILDNMGNAGWGLLCLLLAALIRVDGKHLFPFPVLFEKGIMWDIVLMMATVFTLATFVTADETGLPELLKNLVMPLHDSMGDLAFILVVSFIIMVLGNLTNTVAISCTFIPILYVLSQDMDLNMYLMVAIINIVDNICLLVPASTVFAAMMYNQREWIPFKWCVGFAVYAMVTIYALVMILGLPLGQILF